ncbi:MAG: sulfotransferase [Sneathiella sp.]|nr:sulfotransferase [Sneathiella sp.]
MKYLFLGGPARSGTTALVQLLNQDPRIALGVERYKYLYADKARDDEIGPDMFERERFFKFDKTETNVKAPGYGPKGLAKMERKFDTVYYRGDKLPSIIKHVRLLNEKFKTGRYIFIFRDIDRMCSSWNVRARKEGDAWPKKNDFRQAVKSYNHLLALALHYNEQNSRRYILVSYEKLFGPDGGECLTNLLASLGMKPHPAIVSYLNDNIENFQAISNKPLLDLIGQKKFIQEHVNWENVEKLKTRFL